MSILATELDWPEGTKFFEVQCRLGIWDVDGWDLDKEPEVKTLGGTVRITPRTPAGRIRLLEPDGKYRVVVAPPLTFAINEFTGRLVNTADNTEGVWVVDPASDTVDPKDFTYSAVVTPKVGSPFTVEFDGTVAINGVYDLANGTTVAPSRGVSVLESRIAKLEQEGTDIEIVSGSVTLGLSGAPIREFYTTAATSFVANGTSVLISSHTAVVWRRDGSGSWSYQAVSDGWTTPTAGPDTSAPTPGTLSVVPGNKSLTLTVDGAMDDREMHADAYRFSINDGIAWTAWQASPEYMATGLTNGSRYSCIAEVRDAALNKARTATVVGTPALVDEYPEWDGYTTFTAPDGTLLDGLPVDKGAAKLVSIATGGNTNGGAYEPGAVTNNRLENNSTTLSTTEARVSLDTPVTTLTAAIDYDLSEDTGAERRAIIGIGPTNDVSAAHILDRGELAGVTGAGWITYSGINQGHPKVGTLTVTVSIAGGMATLKASTSAGTATYQKATTATDIRGFAAGLRSRGGKLDNLRWRAGE